MTSSNDDEELALTLLQSSSNNDANAVPPPPPTESSSSNAAAGPPSWMRSPRTPGSRPGSRAPSPTPSEMSTMSATDGDLPTNVSETEQLRLLPDECLSGREDRPLRHIDEMGHTTDYALQPMYYSVFFILVVELLERFSFYGINYTQTSYLTGAYDPSWNAGMDSVPASSYVSISVAVAYTTPFLGALLADSILGDYWSILVGALCFYVPGLFLIAFTTIPGFLGPTFNGPALATGLLFLWPCGTGIVKSIVNVFGAKQFHPLLQSSLIESYYVSFYSAINLGALIGGVMIPLLAQRNVTIAYFVPVGMLSLGLVCFLTGSPRYVRSRPKGSLCGKKKLPAMGGTGDSIPLTVIMRVSLLVVPFNIAYSQMATTFIVQGTVMRKAFGFIDAASMNNADAVAVLAFGHVVGSYLYPAMARHNIKIPTTYKFAIGSALGALAIAWALMVEAMIHKQYNTTGGTVSVMWQAMAYILIGAGEIFAVSAAYEVSFTASPPDKKVLASAVNLFCIGGLPNVICIYLYHACRRWFENARGTTSISRLEDYASAHIGLYFWLLFAISVAGIFLNLLPPVKRFVESIEERATDMIKSPKTPSRPPRREEESPLLRARRHQAYLKYGSGPVLYKQGSMRAGASLSQRGKAQRPLRRSQLKKLYRSEPAIVPGVGSLMTAQGKPIMSAQGRPIMAGDLIKSKVAPVDRDEPGLMRSSSE